MKGETPGVTFVVNNPGFFISHRLNLADAVNARNPGASRLVSPPPSAAQARLLKEHRIRSLTSPLRPANLSPVSIFLAFCQALRLSFCGSGEIFYLITIIPTLLYGLPLRIFRRRMMVPIPGLGSFFYSKSLRARLFQKLIARLYRFILNGRNSRAIVQNQDHLQTLLEWGVHREKISYIPGSGVDEKQFSFSPRTKPGNPPRILVPARLLADKGIREACRASALLDEWNISHRMVFAGEKDPGNPSALSETDLRELSSSCPSVIFLGYVSNMQKLLLESDLVCLPSYHEGLPRALIEAFAIGRPVVTTNTSGCREIVSHGHTGLLAPVGDHRILATHLKELIQNEETGSGLSKNAREFFLNNLTLKQVTKKTMLVLESLTGEKNASRDNREEAGVFNQF